MALLGRTAVSALLGDPRLPQQLYESASKMATAILAAKSPILEGLRLGQAIFSQIVDSRPKDTIQYFREALAINPNLPDVVTVLVQTLFAENQDAEAESSARNGLGTFKNYSPLCDTLYGYYMAHNRVPEAEQLLRSQIANNPKQAFLVIQLARHLRGCEEISGSGRTPARVCRQRRRITRAAPLDAGDFYRRAGNPDEAIRLYQLGLASSAQRKPDRTSGLPRAYSGGAALTCVVRRRRSTPLEALLETVPSTM